MAKYTAKQVAQALLDANGILAQAAKNLGCTRQTVYNYINKHETVKAAYEEANETTIDFVESKLMEQVRVGNITAIIFFLKTKGRNRGYVERQEVTGKDGGPVEHDVKHKFDPSTMSDDELKNLIAKRTSGN